MKILPSVILPLFITAGTEVVSACSCASIPTTQEAFNEVDTIFCGTVHQIAGSSQDGFATYKVTFDVDDHWKGKINSIETVFTSVEGCGYPFKKGLKYLVYAHRDGSQKYNRLVTDRCTRTKNFLQAEEDLEILSGLNKPNMIEVVILSLTIVVPSLLILKWFDGKKYK